MQLGLPFTPCFAAVSDATRHKLSSVRLSFRPFPPGSRRAEPSRAGPPRFEGGGRRQPPSRDPRGATAAEQIHRKAPQRAPCGGANALPLILLHHRGAGGARRGLPAGCRGRPWGSRRGPASRRHPAGQACGNLGGRGMGGGRGGCGPGPELTAFALCLLPAPQRCEGRRNARRCPPSCSCCWPRPRRRRAPRAGTCPPPEPSGGRSSTCSCKPWATTAARCPPGPHGGTGSSPGGTVAAPRRPTPDPSPPPPPPPGSPLRYEVRKRRRAASPSPQGGFCLWWGRALQRAARLRARGGSPCATREVEAGGPEGGEGRSGFPAFSWEPVAARADLQPPLSVAPRQPRSRFSTAALVRTKGKND